MDRVAVNNVACPEEMVELINKLVELPVVELTSADSIYTMMKMGIKNHDDVKY